MDKTTRDVRAFHEAFGCPVRKSPELPELDGAGEALVMAYAQQMLVLARRLKESAAAANRRGQRGLGEVLVRLQLHVEEGGELGAALALGDMTEVLDALGDIDYVTAGTYHVVGMARLRRKAADVIHESNMSKLGADGRPILHESGRVVKGPGYRDPKAGLRRLLE